MDIQKIESKVKDSCRRIVEGGAISAEQIGQLSDQSPDTVSQSLNDGQGDLSLKTLLAIAGKNPEALMAVVHEAGYFMVKHPPKMAEIDKYDDVFLSCVSNFNKLSATMRKHLDTGEVTRAAAQQIAKEAADVLLVAGSVYTLAKKTASGG